MKDIFYILLGAFLMLLSLVVIIIMSMVVGVVTYHIFNDVSSFLGIDKIAAYYFNNLIGASMGIITFGVLLLAGTDFND